MSLHLSGSAGRVMESPTVLHLIPGLGIGGAERSLAEMLPAFAAAGISSSVVCFFEREGIQELVQAAGFDVRCLRARSWWGRFRELRALLRAERPDILHTVLFEADVIGRLAAGGTGVLMLTSLVSTSYEPVRLQDPNVRRSRLAAARIVDGWTARHLGTHFHAITPAVKESAARRLKLCPERITVIERGRDARRLGDPTPERRARARFDLGLEDWDSLVLTVGRQEFAKGHRFLVEAFARISDEVPGARLVVAGPEGHASGELENAVTRHGVQDRVRLLGGRSDVPELMAAADLFVFPSLYEGLGGALIEAMALGLPVVASDIPAIRGIVEDGRSALLAPPASPEALAAAVVRLLKDPERRASFGRRGREIFETRFTLQRSTQRMIELYRSLVADRAMNEGQVVPR